MQPPQSSRSAVDGTMAAPGPILFAAEAEQFAVALRSAGLAVWRLDLASDILALSPEAQAVLGTGGELAWSSWLEHLTVEDRGRVDAMRSSLESAPSEFRLEISFRRSDGDLRWLAITGGVMRDAAGSLVRVVGTVTDQTVPKLEKARTARMIGALQHRGKNLVAVVRSIANRTLGASADLEDFGAHFDGRLSALARVQSIISRSEIMTADLEELIREELLHHAQDDERVTVLGPAIALDARTAELLGLVVHELAMNAIKFGALSTPRGRIVIGWSTNEPTDKLRLKLTWRESGVALINPAPGRVGFGRELLETGLPYQLGAAVSLSFAPGGLECTIDAPLDV